MDDSAAAIIKRLSAALQGRVRFAVAFGSMLGPRFDSESDVDLAVLPNLDPTAREGSRDLWRLLSPMTDRDLDLIDLSSADPIITMQVLANGQLIYAADPVEFLLFKARKISEYLDFKSARRVAEDVILRRRIYA